MKVLMVGPDRSVHGGISGVVNNYYEAGLDQKIELCYIGTMVEGSKLRKLLQAVKAYLIFLRRLTDHEIVHVNMASDMSYRRKSFFIRTAHRFGKKLVIHQHGGDFVNYYEKQLTDRGRKRLRRTLDMADVFLVLTPVWKTFFGKLIGEEKIVVLPDAVKIPEEREKLYGQHRILFLGRLCRAKGIGELLEIIPALRQKYPEVKLYLGGIWEDKELQKQALKYPEQVEWLGWITGKEKERYLEACDIFVMPSYFEGQSVSILEAMAASCAIVAAETGGIPYMISQEETGILVKPHSAEALLNGLDRVLGDEKLCAKIGKNAREKVSQEFALDQTVLRLCQIYEGI
ncbi:MAG: glycosyltransferase family 4 protein [Eubacteriales bacterium]|nr:glycosyltransferase family 4 protein [Eubacteriales bacterium]